MIRAAFRLLFASCIVLLSVAPAMAQQQIVFANMVPTGFCQFTASTAATLATSCSGIPAKSLVAVIVDETQSTRWRDDGTAPTTSVGMLLSVGSTLTYQGDLTKIQFVAVSGSPVMDVSFYGIH